jgi:phosphoribosyl-ATP pyrophosphohydrolase/phosphoribosyl-AMP cyclohydrolase
MAQEFIQRVKFDDKGLIPAVVQDAATGEVIALCHMDNTALASTLRTGRISFLAARSDETTQLINHRLVDVRLNADGTSLTVIIERQAAHEGEKPMSLLRDMREAQKSSSEVSLVDVGSMEFGIAINNLYALIVERKEKRPEGSYTSYLFNSGLDKILKKIAEEAGEVIIAAKNRSSREIVSELADLFYHLLVLMVERDIRLGDVYNELARRASIRPRLDEAEQTPEPGAED